MTVVKHLSRSKIVPLPGHGIATLVASRDTLARIVGLQGTSGSNDRAAIWEIIIRDIQAQFRLLTMLMAGRAILSIRAAMRQHQELGHLGRLKGKPGSHQTRE